jgi:hypothetical protein
MHLRKKPPDQADHSAPKHDRTSGSGLPALLRMIGRLVPSPPQRRLSYEDAIGWFIDHRPPRHAAARGAILRTALPDGGTEIVQFFLDAQNQPVCASNGTPHARRFVVRELDEELTEAFGRTRLLIIN